MTSICCFRRHSLSWGSSATFIYFQAALHVMRSVWRCGHQFCFLTVLNWYLFSVWWQVLQLTPAQSARLYTTYMGAYTTSPPFCRFWSYFLPLMWFDGFSFPELNDWTYLKYKSCKSDKTVRSGFHWHRPEISFRMRILTSINVCRLIVSVSPSRTDVIFRR